MITLLLAWTLSTQDPDFVVNARAGRREKEYELALSGKGKGLREMEFVSLKFRPRANRVDWSDASIVTVALDEETARLAPVEAAAFTHRERFAVPGEVEVRIGLRRGDEDVPGGNPIERVFRVATLPEEAYAIGGAAKRVEAAIRLARNLIEDLQAPSGRRETRIERRIPMLRAELEENFLTASTHALGLWLSDVENAWELLRCKKDLGGLLSSIDGAAFGWAEAVERLNAIEAISLRERGLLVVRCAASVAREAAVAASGWARVERELVRSVEMLLPLDAAAEPLLSRLKDYLQAAAAHVLCSGADDADFVELGRALLEQAASMEAQYRNPH